MNRQTLSLLPNEVTLMLEPDARKTNEGGNEMTVS